LIVIEVSNHCLGSSRRSLRLHHHILFSTEDQLALLFLSLPNQIIVISIARLIDHFQLDLVLSLGLLQVLKFRLQFEDEFILILGLLQLFTRFLHGHRDSRLLILLDYRL
jgi:hypothetical protein